MNTVFNDIASLISIRQFLTSSVENLTIKMTREEVKAVQARVTLLDKTIIEKSVAMDLASFANTSTTVRTFVSSEDTAVVLGKIRREHAPEDAVEVATSK